jgi:hypothetical protein
MKNTFSYKALITLCFLLSLTNKSQADYNQDCCPVKEECCQEDTGCGNPLRCGSVDFQIQAGVAPTLWRDRGNFSAITCNGLAIPDFGRTTVDLFKLPKFNKLFHVPWIVGGHIGYAITNNFETYVEFNYRQAKARDFTLLNVTIPNDVINIDIHPQSRYRVFDVYLGARYYWDLCWCYDVAFFLGGKFGLVHHKQVNFTFNFVSVNCPPAQALAASCAPLFLRNTTPAGGLNIGFEWCLGCNFSAVLTAEVVATCGPKGSLISGINFNCTNPMLPTIFPTNLIVGHIGSEIFFPITLGLKYSF